MSPDIMTEARLLGLSVLTGAGLMAVYDGLRLIRYLIPHGALLTGAEDFCYWIFTALTTFYLLYRENDGTIRFYIIGGVLLSMAAYDRIFSANFRKLLKKAGRWIRIQLSK